MAASSSFAQKTRDCCQVLIGPAPNGVEGHFLNPELGLLEYRVPVVINIPVRRNQMYVAVVVFLGGALGRRDDVMILTPGVDQSAYPLGDVRDAVHRLVELGGIVQPGLPGVGDEQQTLRQWITRAPEPAMIRNEWTVYAVQECKPLRLGRDSGSCISSDTAGESRFAK